MAEWMHQGTGDESLLQWRSWCRSVDSSHEEVQRNREVTQGLQTTPAPAVADQRWPPDTSPRSAGRHREYLVTCRSRSAMRPGNNPRGSRPSQGGWFRLLALPAPQRNSQAPRRASHMTLPKCCWGCRSPGSQPPAASARAPAALLADDHGLSWPNWFTRIKAGT